MEEAECLRPIDEAGSVAEPSAVCVSFPYGIIASLFPPKRSASRVLADEVQLALLHMNLLNEIPNANQALVSSLEGESVVIGGDIKTALRSVALSDSNSP